MTLNEKRRLLESLTQMHSATRETLEGIDLELPVYQDSGWRIRDIIGHIATWDRQVAMSLRAFRVGQEYALPDHDEAVFNEQDILNQQDLTAQQVFQEWELAREEFKEAVDEIPLDLFPGDLLYPWGDERGSIAHLVETMTEHDVEHRDEIVKAIESSARD
ncbi:MAG TPA: DinB family protein [Anaerolineae bacterium]|nr:DinB family protein [Anaerolineae bacterium]